MLNWKYFNTVFRNKIRYAVCYITFLTLSIIVEMCLWFRFVCRLSVCPSVCSSVSPPTYIIVLLFPFNWYTSLRIAIECSVFNINCETFTVLLQRCLNEYHHIMASVVKSRSQCILMMIQYCNIMYYNMITVEYGIHRRYSSFMG